MAESMSVEAILSAVDQNFSRTMEQAVNQLSQVASRGTSAGSATMRSGIMMGAGMTIASKAMAVVKDSLGGAINRFDTLNKYPVVMKALGYSTQDVAKSSQTLQKGIDGLPTSLDEITGIAQQLGPLTGSANKASKSAIALNNAFLASGASVSDTSRGLQQYTQMLSTGKVDLMSYRTLMETMPIALRKVANSFGFTGKSAENDLYSALKDGKITTEQLNDRFIKLNGGVNGFASLAKKNSAGIGTSFANLKNSVVKNLANMMTSIDQGFANAGFGSIAQQLDGMKGGINAAFTTIGPIVTQAVTTILQILRGLINFVNANKGWLAPLATGVVSFMAAMTGLGKGASIVTGVIGKLKTFSSIGTILTTLSGKFPMFSSGIKLVVGGLRGLWAAMMANPIIAVIVAITAIVAGLTWFFTQTQIGRQAWQTFTTWLAGVWQGLVAVASTVWNAIVTTVTGVVQAVIGAWNAFQSWIAGFWQGVLTVTTGVWNGILSFLSGIWSAITSTISGAINAVQSFVSSGFNAVVSVISGMMNSASSVISSVWNTIKSWFQAGINFIKSVVHVDLGAAGRKIIQSLLDGMLAVWSSVKGFVSKIAGWIKDHKGPLSYDAKLLVPAGNAIMSGLNTGLMNSFAQVQSNVSSMAGQIQAAVTQAQTSYASGFGNLQGTINSTVGGQVGLSVGTQPTETNRLLRQIAQKDTTMVLDDGTLIGATYGAYDRKLGQNVALSGRWS
ncbi:tape measure protein [Limosilactobacillus fermentum]|uniref:tape measure protein n=1 Tax=Limosilactobacillus fermentum TaxID=1613 RepID=UPI00187F9BBA|nr:tape measure protein [Limosilactobacillus fermentum]MBE8118128.1 tape measure protein [Limosilactobacillus fermentum]